MFLIDSVTTIGTMKGCQEGKNYLSDAGYQSSRTYLALPDILKTSFPLREQRLNAKNAPAVDFDEFISLLVDINEQNVNRSIWPIHHRWRAINKCLEADVLVLSEVDGEFLLEVLDGQTFLPEVQSEVTENSNKPASEAVLG